MKGKSILLMFVVLFGVLAGGITSRLLAQSSRPIPIQTAPTEPAQQVATLTGQAWEYRILRGSYSGYAGKRADPTDYLERGINEAAAQGFEVQSFQSTQDATNVYPNVRVIVLLRRPRK